MASKSSARMPASSSASASGNVKPKRNARLMRIASHTAYDVAAPADIEDLMLAPKRGSASAPAKSTGCHCGAAAAEVAPGTTWATLSAKPARAPCAVAAAAGTHAGHEATAHLGMLGKQRIETKEDYMNSLSGRGLTVYLFGKLVPSILDHPMIKPSINAVAETYQLAVNEPAMGLVGADESVSGLACNRFLHICMSAADVAKQSKMQRRLGQMTGTCFQRCVGMDAFNSCYSTTFDIDQKHGTNFHAKFKQFVTQCQIENCVIGGAMTDPKGDRSKGPGQQDDPDLFARIVERRVDGIVIRGAKMHQTGTLNAHWMLVMPGGRLKEDEKEFAVVCAVPVTAPGITYIYGRQSCDTRSMEETETDIDQGNAKFGGQEATIIFEDVFVPYARVFMDGQTDFCATLVERFTAYHRRSYICKAGLGDVLIGAAATVSDYNGTSGASHIKNKLVEMAYLNENIAGTAMAASMLSTAMPAGNYQPDVLMANVCKHNVTRFPYEIARLAQDLAGGLMVTMPSDQDFNHAVAGPLLRKYLVGKKGTSVDHRRRIMRLIENITMGRNAVGYLTESMHGAGSPEAQRVLIKRLMNLEEKKGFAKNLAGIA